jgi:ribosomal protein S18 acetylase RimI-like enzyme
MLLVSVVLIEDDTDPMSLKEHFKQFVDELKTFDGLDWAKFLESLTRGIDKDDKLIKKAQEKLKAMLIKFLDSLPGFPPIIRPMRDEDLERIIEIDYQILGVRRPDFWMEKIELLKKKSHLPPLVAETGNKVIGFILGEASSWEYVVPENIGWIDTLGIDPAYQRKGVAKMLAGEMIAAMENIGVNTVYTLVDWRDGDILQFLNHMGFKRGNMINLMREIEIGVKKSYPIPDVSSYSNEAVKEINLSLPDETPLTIRTMREEDIERIREIDHQLLGERRLNFWKDRIKMLRKKSHLPPLVAETGNKVIGFILGEASSWGYAVLENIGWIDTLGIDPAYQRKGVAKMLMREILNQMKGIGVNTVYTLVNWQDWNFLQFFDSMGFKRGEIINLELKVEDFKKLE